MHKEKLLGNHNQDSTTSREDRKDSIDASLSSFQDSDRQLREKQFLLSCERGDIGSVRKLLATAQADGLDINCVDPLGRSALLIAVENENIEMIELLLDNNIETGDAILYAIGEENVEAVEIIIEHLEKIEKFNPETQGVEINEHSAFTPDITPIILAAHKDNFECYKLLYDKKATIPRPHDVNCDCDECETARTEDSLRLSRSRINAYRALTSPSHISLHASDPILYAFELSYELRRLSYIENEFRSEYQELSQKCQKFSVNMLDQVRGSKELEIILNYTSKTWEEVTTRGHHLSEMLARLKLAVKLRQKKFVAHPNCQQLLAGIWYEGLPIRNRNIFIKVLLILCVTLGFPVWSLIYLIAPKSSFSGFIRKPFVKFLSHSGSYCFFLLLLILASQRIDRLDDLFANSKEGDPWRKERRGPPPTIVETAILLWVFGLIWVEIKQLWDSGLFEYCYNLWNILDFITNSLYMCTFALRTVAYYQVEMESNDPLRVHLRNLPRNRWEAWDPTLISECLFATANIFSSLKLVHIFTVNPHLGPLKISLGRMVIDILKFFLVYCLVLFAFACGLNQLMWYYAAMRQKECDEYKRLTAFTTHENLTKEEQSYSESCEAKYRSCASIYHTVETLFWSMFGLIDLTHFSVREEHWMTEWTGKTIFGSYSCCSIIVLLNMLIAMMSNSYTYISNQADVEWKFARSKLWIEYFDDTATLPPPFNMIPSPKSFYYSFKWICDRFCRCSKVIQAGKQKSIRRTLTLISEQEELFLFVTRNLTKRYIAQTQRVKQQSEGVNEDDVNEIKQDISAFRYELLGILRNAGFVTGHTDMNQKTYSRNKKKSAMAERRLKKGLPEFNIPVPESFQASRRQSLAVGDIPKSSPLKLPVLNWKKLKKKVAFTPTTSPQQQPASSSLTPPTHNLKNLKSISFDVEHLPTPSTTIEAQQPMKRTTTIERPPLQKQRRKSSDTVLELEDDDIL